MIFGNRQTVDDTMSEYPDNILIFPQAEAVPGYLHRQELQPCQVCDHSFVSQDIATFTEENYRPKGRLQ